MDFTKIKWAIVENLKVDGKPLLFRSKDKLDLLNNFNVSTSIDSNDKKDMRE